jgi:hypothetical protein
VWNASNRRFKAVRLFSPPYAGTRCLVQGGEKSTASGIQFFIGVAFALCDDWRYRASQKTQSRYSSHAAPAFLFGCAQPTP